MVPATLSTLKISKIVLVGNPNSGKTTLFNALTGSSQRIGNYAGVTVEQVSGNFCCDEQEVECIDVPGLYSLKPISVDESIAAQLLENTSSSGPNLLVYVLDASHLERNLFLFSQIAEAKHSVLVALTMTDHLKNGSTSIDVTALCNSLGVEVISVVAHKGMGVLELKRAICRNLSEPKVPKISLLSKEQISYTSCERYEWAKLVCKQVLSARAIAPVQRTTDRIDKILTHRVYGLLFFILVMFSIFQGIYFLATPLMKAIDGTFGYLNHFFSASLKNFPILESLIVDGALRGVGTALLFLPQIAILFLLISALESTGYLARVAFLMDRLFGWCGLNGRAFIPLLSSFACAIPGIMATRVMPDQRSRLATILIAPLMSCSARLPIYILLIGAFIEPQFGPSWAGFSLFAMHLVGLILAIPIAWIINRKLFKSKKLPFVFELPMYQWPKWRDALWSVYNRSRMFIKTAGTTIIKMSILIWALLYFPRYEGDRIKYLSVYNSTSVEFKSMVSKDQFLKERYLESSLLGRFSKAVEPIFLPAGFDWRITTAIMAAFPARELIVPSLGIIFQLGSDQAITSSDLRVVLKKATWPDGTPLMGPWNAVGLMIFFALCCQCMATLATVKRETNSWKWPIFIFSYMTILAYLFSVGIYQLSL